MILRAPPRAIAAAFLFAALALSAGNAFAAADSVAVDFAAPDAVLNLRQVLAPNQVGQLPPGSVWFTVQVKNEGMQPASRVLVAEDAPTAGLSVSPLKARATLKEIAASDANVIIERASAYGRRAFRVILPAAHKATLALHFEDVQQAPSLFAWTESALIARNRSAAILLGLVAGLLVAATAIATGVAVLSGRRFANWGAVFLSALLFASLTSYGLFDNGWLTYPGGPYGLFGLAVGIALGAAIRLVDLVAPFEAARPGTGIFRDYVAVGVVLLGIAAFAGVPGTGLAVRILGVFGAALAAGYLAHCGRLGIAGARKLTPTAAIFALVTAAAAFQALGLFEGNLVAPSAIGGFAAAGALLLAIAAAAGDLEAPTVPARATSQTLGSKELTTQPSADRARSRALSAVAASYQGVFDLDLKTGTLALTPEIAAILGLPKVTDELSAETWLQRIHPQDREVYEQAIASYRSDPGLAFRLEFRARGEGNKMEWFELRATVTGKGAKADHCLGLIANVSARKSSEAEFARAALNDQLTGLGNRMALMGRLEEIDGALADAALVVFDIDRFKTVNASLGPDGADVLLRSVAERMTQRFAANASLYRVGGDMFAMVADSNGELGALGGAVVEMMKTPFTAGGRDIFLPASVGVAAGSEAGDPLDLLGQAELAMIQAKRDGGGRVCVYSRALSNTAVPRPVIGDPVALETELRNALKMGQIEVFYQPIMRMTSNGVAGFEALLRWRHPEHGLVAPEEFVAHAEETGLIVPLGRLALRRAAEDLSRWQQFFPLKPPLFVSVNVSWRQVNDEAFSRDLDFVLKNTQLAKHTLKLELTESAVMADADAAEASLHRLRKMGAGLAIDDFGTGHSSLAHLKRFPFDVIKVDRTFLSDSKQNGGETILASIVALAHELGMHVVAEGVETESEAERLRALGCEFAQGYLFGAPLPASQVTGFIAMTYKK